MSCISGKLSRTVLRRGKGSNPFSLVDYTSDGIKKTLILGMVGLMVLGSGILVFADATGTVGEQLKEIREMGNEILGIEVIDGNGFNGIRRKIDRFDGS